MSYSLRDYADIKKAVSDELYASEKGFIIKHHGPYHIIKYNRNNLNKDTEKTVGRFRSILVDDTGRIICFAPPKSLSVDINELEKWAPIKDCSIA